MPPLLHRDDPEPVLRHRTAGRGPFVLTCDHAGNAVPTSLQGGAPPQRELDRHIGWDPGAYALARRMSELLDAPLVAQRYSRLVIDCNRRPGVVASIPTVSDGTPLAFNEKVSEADRARREHEILHPYHDAISELLDARSRSPVILVPVHSFTPVLAGQERPWHVSLMCDDDRRVHDPLLEHLRARHPDLEIGDNEPYRVEPVDFTVPVHGSERGTLCSMIEVRQNLLGDTIGTERYARLLGEALQACARQLL